MTVDMMKIIIVVSKTAVIKEHTASIDFTVAEQFLSPSIPAAAPRT